jgi:hypothetical protein
VTSARTSKPLKRNSTWPNRNSSWHV